MQMITLIILVLLLAEAEAGEFNCTTEEIVEDGNDIVIARVDVTDEEILVEIEVVEEYRGLRIHEVLFRLGGNAVDLMVPLKLSDSTGPASTWIIGTEEKLMGGQIVVLFGSPCPLWVIKNLSSAMDK